MPRPLIPDRRERILDAAEALVLDRGFDAMTIQHVAERCGIAKGAVYREFESKQQILDVLLRRGMERMQRASRERLGDDATPRLSVAYRVAVRVLLDDPLMCAAFLDDEGVLGAYAATVDDGRYRERHAAVVDWIAALQRDGLLDARLAPRDLGLALSSFTIGLLTSAKLLGPLTSEELEGAIAAVELLVAGLEPAG